MQLVLTFEDPGRGRRRGVILRDRVVFGRTSGPDRIVIEAPGIVEPHAEIACEDDGTVTVRALSPDAALFCNGRLVDVAVLSPGDTLHFGTTAARVVHERDRVWSEPAPRAAPVLPGRRARGGRTAGRWTAVAVAACLLALLAISDRETPSPTGPARSTSLATRPGPPPHPQPSPRVPAPTPARPATEWRPAPTRHPEFSDVLDSVVGLKHSATGRRSTLGSGFIATSEGLVVTNAHVVEGTYDVEAILRDGTRIWARVATEDRARDIALVRLPRGDAYRALEVAPTAGLRIGASVWAIGFPYSEALAFTVTRGIVSGVRRVPGLPVMVQHDAAINPGNSGGPLLDDTFRVVGINTWKLAGGDRIGFAVAGDEILDLLESYR